MFLKVLHQPAPAASAKGGVRRGQAGQGQRRGHRGRGHRGQQPVRNLHAPVNCWLVTACVQCGVDAGIVRSLSKA